MSDRTKEISLVNSINNYYKKLMKTIKEIIKKINNLELDFTIFNSRISEFANSTKHWDLDYKLLKRHIMLKTLIPLLLIIIVLLTMHFLFHVSQKWMHSTMNF